MFRQHYAMLCRAVIKLLPQAEVAEDLVQEVFYEVWKKREGFRITVALGPYLRRAAVNKALNYIRDRKIRWDDEDKLPFLASDQPAAGQLLELEELQRRIDAVVDALPERCRLVFSLSRYEEMSNQEIADQLGISIKTVENQMTKALRLLRAALF